MDTQQNGSVIEERHRPRVGYRLDGKNDPVKIMGELSIVTEAWNRVVAVPYIVYLPEKDRLLMLISCDYPHVPLVLDSDDHGKTWSAPRPVEKEEPAKDANPYGHHVGVSLTYLGRGKVLFSIESMGRYFSGDFGQTWQGPISRPPTLNGKTWSQWDPYLVDRDPKTGNVVRLVETGYSCDPETQAEIRFSYDEGKTWSQPIRVPEWKGLNEVALVRAANGDIVGACRTELPERFKDHLDHYEGLGISISKDNGLTWSKFYRLYEWGRHHPSLVLLPNGEILMTYVVRLGYPNTDDGFLQFGIEAVISRDHGRTWDMDHRYILAEWAGNRKGENAWWPSSQATSTVLLPDGSLLTAFGTGFRSRPNEINLPGPRDVGLIRWSL
jgi:hypothetical protein